MLIDRSRIFAEALADRLDREADMSVVAVRVAPSPSVAIEADVDAIVCDDHLADAVLGSTGPRRRRPPHVVVLADQGGQDLGAGLVARGAAGWVSRDSTSGHLVDVLRGVCCGETWVPPDLLTSVIDELTARQQFHQASTDRLRGLTTREREILDLLGRGMDRAQVAKQLNLSRNTVRTHVQNILGRLDVHSTLAAVAIGRASSDGISLLNPATGQRAVSRYVR